MTCDTQSLKLCSRGGSPQGKRHHMITLKTPHDLMTAERTPEILNCEKGPALAGVSKSSHSDRASVPPR
jgi:hypothetical protein